MTNKLEVAMHPSAARVRAEDPVGDAEEMTDAVLSRIGYVLKVFPRVSETFVINEIRALENLGVPLRTFSLHAAEQEVSHGILRQLRHPTRYVDAAPMPSEEAVKSASKVLQRRLGVAPEFRPQILPRKYVRLAVALSDLVRAEKIRHLHAHFASRAGHVAALTAALVKCSYSVTAHAKDLYHRDVNRDVLRWLLSGARLVVTVTDYNKRYLETLLANGTPVKANLVRLYNGVDLDRFRAEPYPQSPPRRILGVGRLVEKKGFAVLIEAARILRDRGCTFQCEIVGGGPEEDSLRERISAAGLAQVVTLHGSVTTERVEELLRTASVVTLPCVVGSDSNVDALPTVLLEAMATARPVVSTHLSGIPEIVTDRKTGFLVPPEAAGALADALQSILEHPQRGEEMGRAGREKAERLFDLRTNAADLRGLLFREAGRRGESG